ncbi:MAG TPA: hypothetical protein VIF15_18735 [Polyangiaceae bacterium]
MSQAEKVGRLEALLARVRARSAEPRRARATESAAAAAPAAEPVTMLDEDVLDAPTRPPPQMTEADIVLEVDVQETSQETVIGVTVEEAVTVEVSLESRERLVAAEPVGLEALGDSSPEAATEIRGVEQESPPEVLADVEEVVEDAPASSRRPVAPEPEEQIAEIAFGAQEPQPPRHTPPPESGRLPAAPVVEFDGDVTGVREATPIAPHRAEELEPTAVSALAPEPVRELTPDVTRARLTASEDVVDVVGEAQRFAPPTFAALLDASLSL